MCFSATVSFITGASLSAVGVITVKKTKHKQEIPFALIPLFFGIQQLIEGLVWLSFQIDSSQLNTITTYAYLLFAYLLWPIYLPFAVRSLEMVHWRRQALLLFQFIGIGLGVYLFYLYTQISITSEIINKSIVYASPNFSNDTVIVLYIIVTCLSAIFSSHKIVNVFGALGFISFLISYWFYTVSFVSVWCFFAALLSFIVYLYFTKFFTKKSYNVVTC